MIRINRHFAAPDTRPLTKLVVLSIAIIGLTAGCSFHLRAPQTNRVTVPESVLHVRWTSRIVPFTFFNYAPQEFAKPLITGQGTVFVGASTGRLWAFGPDGKVQWTVDTGGPIFSQPLYCEETGSVYLGSDDGRMYAVDAATGKVLWQYATKGAFQAQPAYANGMLLFTTSENRVYGLVAQTGQWRWQYDREAPRGFTIHGHSGVLIRNELAYVGFSDGMIVALKSNTGDVAWTRQLGDKSLPFADVDTTPVAFRGQILAASYNRGLYALAPDSGAVQWQRAIEGVSHITTSGDRIAIASTKNGLTVADERGQPVWQQRLPAVASAPVIVGRYILISSSRTGLYVAHLSDGELAQYFDPDGGLSAGATVGSGMVAILADQGTLYAFDY